MKIIYRLACMLLILSAPITGNANLNDSLLMLFASPDDSAKVTDLNNLADQLSATNCDSAILVSKQALQLSRKINYEEGIGKSLHNLGLFTSITGDRRLALRYLYEALDIWVRQEAATTGLRKNQVLKNKSRTLAEIGSVYLSFGDFPRALEYLFIALKINEGIGEKKGIESTLCNIGTVYTEQGYPSKALDYYFKSLKVGEELHDKDGMAITLGNIGTVYDEQGNYAKALSFYSRALQLDEECGDQDGVSTWLGNIGMAYQSMDEYEKALEYYFDALEIAKKTGNEPAVAVHLRAIGILYTKMKRYSEAEEYLLQALAIDETSNSMLQMMDDEEALSNLYSATGRHALALDHYKKYATVKDSLYNEENATKSVRTEMNYEFEKKEANQKAEHDKAVFALETENRIAKTARNFIIALSFMLLGMIIIGFTWFNNRKNLRVKEKFSQQLILSQEKERQRISKELHDSIGQNMLFIKNQLIKQNDTALLVSVNETLEEVRNISKDLYPNQLERYGLAAAVDALAEKVKETTSIFVSHDLEAFGKEISSDKQINYFRIIQECITNTIKHSEATALRITASVADGMIELIVQDNGKGFDKLILAKKAQHSFGMLNIEERVNYLQGRFEVQTSPGNGTKYTFNLPV